MRDYEKEYFELQAFIEKNVDPAIITYMNYIKNICDLAAGATFDTVNVDTEQKESHLERRIQGRFEANPGSLRPRSSGCSSSYGLEARGGKLIHGPSHQDVHINDYRL